jgi:hypothetical protein
MWPKKTGSRVKHALARDGAVYSLVWFVSGEPFHLFTMMKVKRKQYSITFTKNNGNNPHNPS